jgi:hypothetical protein
MYQDYRTLRRISLRDDFIAVACAPEEGRFFATLISIIDNSPADKVALVRIYDVLDVNDEKVREALASVAMILHPSKFQTADTYGVAWFSVQRKLIVTVDSMEQLKTVSRMLESIGAVESLSSKQAALEARSIHQRGKLSGDRASHSEIARISLRHEGASSSCP